MRSVKLRERLGLNDDFLRGDISIELDYHDGNGRQKFFEKKNLIVKAAKQYILSFIYAAGVTSDPITQLRVGTGGCIDPQGLYPKVEDPLQTDLVTPLISFNVVAVPDTDNIKVTYLADVDQSQGNGSLITEAGLIKQSGALFNVKNHPGIAKTSDFSIHYSWTIRLL